MRAAGEIASAAPKPAPVDRPVNAQPAAPRTRPTPAAPLVQRKPRPEARPPVRNGSVADTRQTGPVSGKPDQSQLAATHSSQPKPVPPSADTVEGGQAQSDVLTVDYLSKIPGLTLAWSSVTLTHFVSWIRVDGKSVNFAGVFSVGSEDAFLYTSPSLGTIEARIGDQTCRNTSWSDQAGVYLFEVKENPIPAFMLNGQVFWPANSKRVIGFSVTCPNPPSPGQSVHLKMMFNLHRASGTTKLSLDKDVLPISTMREKPSP